MAPFMPWASAGTGHFNLNFICILNPRYGDGRVVLEQPWLMIGFYHLLEARPPHNTEGGLADEFNGDGCRARNGFHNKGLLINQQ